LTIAALALTLAACGDDDDGDGAGSGAQTTVTTAAPAVTADMVAADGSPAGRVTFTETGGRLTVEAQLTNLPPGFHGFHIHATGKCERGTPPFTSAGGHMVVGQQAHPAHAGDQPVVLVMSDRSADIRFTTDRYKLSDLQVPEGRGSCSSRRSFHRTCRRHTSTRHCRLVEYTIGRRSQPPGRDHRRRHRTQRSSERWCSSRAPRGL
jgi:Cu/Zn superoxide dismutase